MPVRVRLRALRVGETIDLSWSHEEILLMNSLNRLVATGLLLGFGLSAQPMVAAAAPGVTVESERAAHPRIVEAIVRMREGLKELEAAPDDFGGNKAAAISDM